jgi:hypothetical protein
VRRGPSVTAPISSSGSARRFALTTALRIALARVHHGRRTRCRRGRARSRARDAVAPDTATARARLGHASRCRRPSERRSATHSCPGVQGSPSPYFTYVIFSSTFAFCGSLGVSR